MKNKKNYLLQDIVFSNNKKTQNNIFTKNINNKLKLTPFNTRKSSVGSTKYLPASSKEWKNNVYYFNNNLIRNFPTYDIIVDKLIRGYFNLYFNNKFLLTKYIPNTLKRLSLNRIYVSKANIKHTSHKAIITIYVFNREEIYLLKKINELKLKFIKIFYFFMNSVIIYKNITINFYKNLFVDSFYEELILFRKYKLMLSLNQYKFKVLFLHKLSKLISKLYNKKVEFNIIKLKTITLNTDILTEILALKVKNKKASLNLVLKFFLTKAIIPVVNKLREKSPLIKNINSNLLQNRYKNSSLNTILIKSNVNETIKKLYNDYDFENENLEIDYINVKDKVFNSIKYKNIGGIRLEVKGRLTRRYRADRAIHRVKWKGGLRNIDSSYKKLSSVKLIGYKNPNVEYSAHKSKRRIGAFAVKGWIGGK